VQCQCASNTAKYNDRSVDYVRLHMMLHPFSTAHDSYQTVGLFMHLIHPEQSYLSSLVKSMTSLADIDFQWVPLGFK
jgi:hypothetical protein